MFKSKAAKGSPGSVPETPKIPKLALPDDMGAGACCSMSSRFASRPSTPLKPPSSIKAHQTPSTKVTPLKSILKGKSSPVKDCYESEGEFLASKKVVRAGPYGVPPLLPPHAHLGPMKPPALDLHWQLLPYQPRRSKHPLHFDIAFPIDSIKFKDYPHPNRPLSSTDLDKPAANEMMTKMVIQFEAVSDWEVCVKRKEGIRCRDVFEAIYSTFNIPLTPYEKRTLIPEGNRELCEEAFRLRCNLAPGLTAVEKKQGLKRVDVLMHCTLFKGLTQPKSGGDWVLNLGRST